MTYTVPSGFANTGTRPLSVAVTTGATSSGNDFFAAPANGSISGTVYNVSPIRH